MLDVLMRGISTLQYAEVLPEVASTCGVSKSNVSREAAEAGEEVGLGNLVEPSLPIAWSIDLRTHTGNAPASIQCLQPIGSTEHVTRDL